jgi:hypothetical protein
MQTGVNNSAPSWPNRIGSGKLGEPTVDQWYNPRDFVAPPPNTYGDSGRGILYGPGHINFDTSLSKRFTVFGRSNAEFRWDAFNLFNHPGFGFPKPELRFANCRTHHVDVGRQPVDAVLGQVQFLTGERLSRGRRLVSHATGDQEKESYGAQATAERWRRRASRGSRSESPGDHKPPEHLCGL